MNIFIFICPFWLWEPGLPYFCLCISLFHIFKVLPLVRSRKPTLNLRHILALFLAYFIPLDILYELLGSLYNCPTLAHIHNYVQYLILQWRLHRNYKPYWWEAEKWNPSFCWAMTCSTGSWELSRIGLAARTSEWAHESRAEILLIFNQDNKFHFYNNFSVHRIQNMGFPALK